ncbi:hypothetical protein AGMMS49944_19630 [Spirochaetia bacterium]|nr:hypothetical protein AGMMS49944_19630 [Spirochaetia bacterium]
MAKQNPIKNVFDGDSTSVDKIDKKYLQYVREFQDAAAVDALTAFKTKNLDTIERTLKKLAVSRSTASYLIGMGALIIEREKLYREAGYGSYLEYTQHLLEDLEIPVSTLSDDKIIMEKYIDYNKPLAKAGFILAGNATKLRYLDAALQNHDEEEVFNRITNDTSRSFISWAQHPNIIKHKPEPEVWVDVKIDGNKLLIDGKNILNFPKNTTPKIRKMISTDLGKTFSIREGGNIPYIIGTYDKGEQTAIENFLKKYRAKK